MNTRHPSYGLPDRPDAFVAWACQCKCHKNAPTMTPGPARQRGESLEGTPPASSSPGAGGTIFTDDDLWDDDVNDWPFVLMVTLAWLTFVLLLIVAVSS